MKQFEKITKFIPALEGVIPADWSVESGQVPEKTTIPTVEYWDVVYRLMDAVFDAPETDNASAAAIIERLRRIYEAEEMMPGILFGMLANGTITDLLRQLRAEDGE